MLVDLPPTVLSFILWVSLVYAVKTVFINSLVNSGALCNLRMQQFSWIILVKLHPNWLFCLMNLLC